MKSGLFRLQKKVLSTSFICIFTALCFAQDNSQNSDFWENVRFGGGIGLSTGSNFFSATLAPSAIYQFNDQFALGLGLNGTYNKRKNFYKSTIFGGSIIGLYNPFETLQISAEFEELNVNRTFESTTTLLDGNYWNSALFIGLGYRSNNITIGVRYDLLFDDKKSVYAEPWTPFIRFYF